MAVTMIAAVGLYVLGAATFRHVETVTCVSVLRAVGFHHTVAIPPNLVEVFPPRHPGFAVILTPSCSSLASLLSIGLLSTLIPVAGGARLLRALFVALLAVFLGNILRISASLAVGYVSNTASLVLFHDWVGSLFSFAYTLLGFMLLLRCLLPRHPATAGEPEGPVMLAHPLLTTAVGAPLTLSAVLWWRIRRAREHWLLRLSLQDGSRDVRHRAITAVADTPLRKEVPLLSAYATSETDPALRQCLAAVLLSHPWEVGRRLDPLRTWANSIRREALDGSPDCPSGVHRWPPDLDLPGVQVHRPLDLALPGVGVHRWPPDLDFPGVDHVIYDGR